jgi:hypothetical protein
MYRTELFISARAKKIISPLILSAERFPRLLGKGKERRTQSPERAKV